jgi:hypothetical protein
MRNRTLTANRVQTGVRLEKRLVKVLKALAELQDLSLGDLIEHLVREAFAGKPPLEEPVLEQVHELMWIYGLDTALPGAPPRRGE